MTKIQEAAETAVTTCLNVRPDEAVLVVTDDQRREIGDAIRDAAREITDDVSIMLIPETGQHGREPTRIAAEAMKAADVVLAPTTYSISHTKARVTACKNGTRIATLPGITEEIFTTSMLADYDDIRERSQKLYDMLEDTDMIRVTSPNGTEITLDVYMKHWHTDTGIIHEEGQFGNLPAGEVDGAPVDANGKIVIDSLQIAGETLAPEGTEVEIKNNKAVSISEDCRLADAFKDIENAANLAELGIGTNPKATLIGNILQDEKVMGTCHFAFGDNTSYGGKSSCDIHWDSVIRKPSIWFDETQIMDQGEFVVDV